MDREVVVVTRVVDPVRLGHAAAGGHDLGSPRQEQIGYLDRLVEQASRIAAQIEHQAPHPLLLEVPHGFADLVPAVLGELGESDVADALVEHEGVRNSREGDRAPLDRHVEQLVQPLARD